MSADLEPRRRRMTLGDVAFLLAVVAYLVACDVGRLFGRRES